MEPVLTEKKVTAGRAKRSRWAVGAGGWQHCAFILPAARRPSCLWLNRTEAISQCGAWERSSPRGGIHGHLSPFIFGPCCLCKAVRIIFSWKPPLQKEEGNSLECRQGGRKVGILEARPGSNISQGSELRASICLGQGGRHIRKELP